MTNRVVLSLRCLLALLLFAAFMTQANAQRNNGKLRYGLKVGVNGANLYDDANATDKSTRVGFTGGAFMKIPLTKRFDIRPELLFSAKGGKFYYTNTVHTDLKLSYVELPLSLEMKLLGILNLHAGLQAGVLVGSDGKLQGSNGNAVNFNFSKDDFQQLDYGWHLGTGLDIGGIGLHFRVYKGLHEVGKSNSVSAVVGSLKNAAWALTLSAAL